MVRGVVAGVILGRGDFVRGDCGFIPVIQLPIIFQALVQMLIK